MDNAPARRTASSRIRIAPAVSPTPPHTQRELETETRTGIVPTHRHAQARQGRRAGQKQARQPTKEYHPIPPTGIGTGTGTKRLAGWLIATHAEAPAKADWWKEVDSLLMLLFPPKLLILTLPQAPAPLLRLPISPPRRCTRRGMQLVTSGNGWRLWLARYRCHDCSETLSILPSIWLISPRETRKLVK